MKSLSSFMCFEAQNNVNSEFIVWGTPECTMEFSLPACVDFPSTQVGVALGGCRFVFIVFIAYIHIAKYNLLAGSPVWTVDIFLSELIREWILNPYIHFISDKQFSVSHRLLRWWSPLSVDVGASHRWLLFMSLIRHYVNEYASLHRCLFTQSAWTFTD